MSINASLPLLDLPTEVLDRIVFFVPHPSSLLALARTCKSFAAMIIPHHLHFRVIRTRLRNTKLWSHLASNRRHAANIYSLKILRNKKYGSDTLFPIVIPSDYLDTVEAGYERDARGASRLTYESALVRALDCMVHLHDFTWYCENVPVLHGENDVWQALRGTPVKSLDIRDRTYGLDRLWCVRNAPALDTPISGLTNLTVTIHKETCNSDDIESFDRLLRNNCPNFQRLRLIFITRHWPIFTVLSRVSWLHLRALYLSRPLDSPGEFAKFVMANSSIEELTLRREMDCDWKPLEQALAQSLSPILPRLKKLECSLPTAVALLFRPLHALEELSRIHLYGENEWSHYPPSPLVGVLLERLSACRSVRHIGIMYSSGAIRELEMLTTAVPKLIRLDIGLNLPASPTFSIQPWCHFLARFPFLKTIGIPNLSYLIRVANYPVKGSDEIIQELARECTGLTILLEREWKVVIIRAGEDNAGAHIRWVVRKVHESDKAEVREGERVYGGEAS